MPHSYGYRAHTRHTFQRGFRKKGVIAASVYMQTYKIGDIVDIVGNGAVQAGMPHRYYHGKTGIVWNVTPNAVGVQVNKLVRTRVMQKRIHVR
jgi:large subunit ribosomal protein L21e